MSSNPSRPATRDQVLAAFDTEFQYQDIRWGPNERPHTVDEWALYILDYAEQARRQASRDTDSKPTLDTIRKIGAMCMRAMLQHGAPLRDLSNVTRA